jgi:hypothetical protein
VSGPGPRPAPRPPRSGTRRDLFRLLGDAVTGRIADAVPGLPAEGGPEAPVRGPAEPATEVPAAEERLVLDLAIHPLPLVKGRRFRGDGWPETVLVVRVSPDHVAAVSADCPCCGGPLAYSPSRDDAACPRGTAFRLDGAPRPGAPRGTPPIASYPCRAAGPRLEIERPGAASGSTGP